MQIDRRVLARAVFLLTMVFTANLALADGGEPCDVVKRLKKKLPAYATVLDLNKLAEENALLRSRVENLESSLADLRSMVNQLAADQAAKAKPIIEIGPATPPPQPAGPVVPPVAAAPKAAEKPAIRSKYNLDMYGYFKWDVAHDSARSEIGNWTRWVTSEAANAGDRQLSMTANQSRFGFNMKGPEAGNAKVSGNLELDLYGGGGTEVAPAIRARHAFLNIEWAKQDLSLLAGHTWDVISPLSPSTLDFYVRWMAGNIGARHPQLRLTKGIKLGDKSKLTLQAAASRPIGDASPYAQIDTGVDGGKPDFQGRIAVEFPTLKNQKIVLGFSGLSGEDEYDLSAAGASIKAHTRSTGIDLTLPILDKLTLKGELWKGSNLDNYMGGVGMGTIVKNASGTTANVPNTTMNNRGALTDVTSVDTKGHWAELAIGPFSKWRYFLGISNDDPDDDVLANGMRSRNQSRWFTAMHDLNEAVQIGIELTRWATQYKNGVEGVNNRAQTSIIYKF